MVSEDQDDAFEVGALFSEERKVCIVGAELVDVACEERYGARGVMVKGCGEERSRWRSERYWVRTGVVSGDECLVRIT